MADGGLPDIVRAIDKGAPVKMVAFEVAQSPYSLMGGKNIKTIADLKGKKISIGGSKDVTKIYLDALMKPAGLKDGDYDLVFAGATSARYAALASGAVDAAILTSPFDFKATGEGFTPLGEVSKVLPDFPFTGLGVNTEWAAKNGKAITGFLTAWKQGIEFLYNPANKQESIDILTKAVGGSPEDNAKTYDYFVTQLHAFRQDMKIPPDSFKKMLDALVGIGDLEQVGNPNRFVDLSFANAVK
jgi:ABC-type nitrate/sulfonate/bicarbonate transport system substrate-binding protein